MKSSLARLVFIVAWFGLLSAGVLAQTHDIARHEPITQQLMTMVEHNIEIKQMLIESIRKAKDINNDRITNPAQTLEEYYAFIDWAAKAMPWSILPNVPYSRLYDQIDQSLDYFYFINDQPLSMLEGKGYWNNSLQYHEPYRTWLINFTREWGLYLSTEASWKPEYYAAALNDERFGLKTDWYEAPANWKTFNDFFARRLSSPNQRPIASPDNPSVVASPADSVPQGIWKIDKDSKIIRTHGVAIKSNVFNSVAELIGEGSAYGDAFANGTLTHTFLDVNDYHRYHFPLAGTIKEVRLILSNDAVGGVVTWNPELKKYMLDSGTPGWQNIETRGCVILDTEDYGLVAILPVGMSQVSSVNFEEAVQPGKIVKKGEMLGYFLFGGSDIVMLFQRGVDFEITSPQESDGRYQHVLMGEEYGRLTMKR